MHLVDDVFGRDYRLASPFSSTCAFSSICIITGALPPWLLRLLLEAKVAQALGLLASTYCIVAHLLVKINGDELPLPRRLVWVFARGVAARATQPPHPLR